MSRDTIFRMASTSKPVTIAAAMILLDEFRRTPNAVLFATSLVLFGLAQARMFVLSRALASTAARERSLRNSTASFVTAIDVDGVRVASLSVTFCRSHIHPCDEPNCRIGVEAAISRDRVRGRPHHRLRRSPSPVSRWRSPD